MTTQANVSVDKIVYDTIVKMGGSFTVARGAKFEGNVARALRIPGAISHRSVYQAVCRLVESKRLAREDVDGPGMQLGSKEAIPLPSARFSIVS
jgi:hypothetical protein